MCDIYGVTDPLVEDAINLNIGPIHYFTDYVFDGTTIFDFNYSLGNSQHKIGA